MSDSTSDRGPALVDLGVLGQVLKVLGPITVVTALLFYFGWVYTAAEARYWSIEASFFDLNASDYVLRSSTATYVPLANGLVAAVVCTLGWRFIGVWLDRRPGAVLPFALGALVIGVVLTLVGLNGLAEAQQRSDPRPGVRLIAGGLLLAAAFALLEPILPRRRSTSATADAGGGPANRAPSGYVAAAFAIVLVGAFGFVTGYATKAGAERAARITREQGLLADLIVYSPEPLNLLTVRGVRQDLLPDAGTGRQLYRYTCLSLLTRIGDKLLVVPYRYGSDGGSRVVYTIDAGSVRLDFDARAIALGIPRTCA